VGPFLEIITRTFGQRPGMLRRNLESLLALREADWRRTLVIDEAVRGVAWANARLRTVEPAGFYVWVLDDDDECCRPALVQELKAIWAVVQADVIVVRMDHGPELGVLPDDARWREAPEEGRIGASALIVRRGVWMKHRESWGERYAGDFDFIAAVLADPTLTVHWHDVTASRCQTGRNAGRGEGPVNYQ